MQPPSYPARSTPFALSRSQARLSDVVKGGPSHPAARMYSPDTCSTQFELSSASGLVLPRTGRRCIGRGHLDGHSDRACDDDSSESRRWTGGTHVLRGRPPPCRRQLADTEHQNRFFVEAVRFSYSHLSWGDERI